MGHNSPTQDPPWRWGQEVTSSHANSQDNSVLEQLAMGCPCLQCWLSASSGEGEVPSSSLSSTMEDARGDWDQA